jgi:hypothetical protein
MRMGNKRKSKRLSHTHKKSSHQHRDVLAYVNKQLKAGRPVAMGHAVHRGMPFESVRDIEYNGHHIIIRTQYQIKVDGKSLSGHIYVDNTGRVSTHALPNYSFTSTVDLVKKLIDAFPANFAKASKKIST